MGQIYKSTGVDINFADMITDKKPEEKVIALGGNPNVGKSTVFNALTGMNQHTGNWPGKTVKTAVGRCRTGDESFILVDLPGTYSLMANSTDEEAARDFICFGEPDAVIIVCDASCLERNLNLVLQTLEITGKVLICVNLLDEAKKKKISIDIKKLEELLNIPVCGVVARKEQGIWEMMKRCKELFNREDMPHKIEYSEKTEAAVKELIVQIKDKLDDRTNERWAALKILEGNEQLIHNIENFCKCEINKQEVKKIKEKTGLSENFVDEVVGTIVRKAEEAARKVVTFGNENYYERDRRIDRILTNRFTGTPIMIFLLLLVFWLTITGANYPSQLIFSALFKLSDMMTGGLSAINAPSWINGVFVDGIYRVLAWVISVMLPPMAIFFPLFTLLEDIGYLPRVAFNLDKGFKRAKSCGKQALTMW